MVDVRRSKGLEQAAGRWREVDIRSLLAESAMAIGAGVAHGRRCGVDADHRGGNADNDGGRYPRPCHAASQGSARSAGKRRPGDAGGDAALRRRAGLRRAARGAGRALEPDRRCATDAGQLHYEQRQRRGHRQRVRRFPGAGRRGDCGSAVFLWIYTDDTRAHGGDSAGSHRRSRHSGRRSGPCHRGGGGLRQAGQAVLYDSRFPQPHRCNHVHGEAGGADRALRRAPGDYPGGRGLRRHLLRGCAGRHRCTAWRAARAY